MYNSYLPSFVKLNRAVLEERLSVRSHLHLNTPIFRLNKSPIVIENNAGNYLRTQNLFLSIVSFGTCNLHSIDVEVSKLEVSSNVHHSKQNREITKGYSR